MTKNITLTPAEIQTLLTACMAAIAHYCVNDAETEPYKAMIERNGGKNSGSISKKTDFVFAGANMGPAKLEKARSLGIPIIGEEEVLKMIE